MLLGDNLIADSLFASGNPSFPVLDGVWVEQCPLVSSWSVQAKDATQWTDKVKAINTWTPIDPNKTTTDECN